MTSQHEEANPGERHGRTIEVFYGDTSFDLKRGEYNASDLATVFKVPAGYVLDLINEQGEFNDLVSDQKIVIKDGMKFASHPPVGRSS